MAKYHIYQIAEDGHTFSGPKTFLAKCDIEAIALAMQMVDGHAVEVWDETRRIGMVEKKLSHLGSDPLV